MASSPSSPIINNSYNNQLSTSGSSVTSSTQSGNIDLGTLSSTILGKFISVLEAALVIFITYLIIRWSRKYFAKIETAHEQQKTALNVLEKIVAGFITIIGLTIALKVVGIDISVLVGVGLIGLSYALKDILQNYVAGILIFLKSPFKLGDIVKIKNYVGRVDKMEFQSTSLKTFDHRDITIYNSDIMSQSIENYSRHNIRRMEIDIKVGYGTDTQKILKTIDCIVNNHPGILKNQKYTIAFKNFADNSMVIKLRFWVPVPSDMTATRSEIAWQINEAFDESTVFGPYERAFQTDSDFTLTAERKKRIQDFYANPIFSANPPAAAITNPQPLDSATAQVAPEAVYDADEPPEEY